MVENEVAELDLNKTNVELINFRLDQLQLSVQAVNAQLASLATGMGGLQTGLAEKFMTRLEFFEVLRQKELQQVVIDKRLDSIDARDHAQDKAILDMQTDLGARGWALAGALGVGVISLLVAAFGLVKDGVVR